jgi:prevent-host-death family protein
MVIYLVMTKSMSAAEFKATCLEVLDRVASTGHTVVVTKRGKPVAQVTPMVKKPRNIVGSMKGDVEILGDIVGPLRVRWAALKK